MHAAPQPAQNVKQVVPFFGVSDIERSVRFYLDGLGFSLKNKWMVEGKIRWCWLELGGAALMLQQFRSEGHDSWRPSGKLGEGVSLCFMCEDAMALYDEFKARALDASEPQVDNRLWVTSIADPDGYRLYFESPTSGPEETKLSEWKR